MSREFECAGCGVIYQTSTSVEDIEEEYKEIYGHSIEKSEEENMSVCDECFKLIIQTKGKTIQ